MVSLSSYSTDELSMLLLPLEPLPMLASSSLPSPQARYIRRRPTAAMRLLGSPNPATNTHDDAQCRYPSKICGNPRVRKASGAFHRYCAYHRDKANANQKRWVGRQREAAPSPTASSSTSSSASSSPVSSSSSSPFSPTAAKYRWIVAARATPIAPAVPTNMEPLTEPNMSPSAATLSDEDWDALFSLLTPPAPLKTMPPTNPRYRRHRTRHSPLDW